MTTDAERLPEGYPGAASTEDLPDVAGDDVDAGALKRMALTLTAAALGPGEIRPEDVERFASAARHLAVLEDLDRRNAMAEGGAGAPEEGHYWKALAWNAAGDLGLSTDVTDQLVARMDTMHAERSRAQS